MEKPICRAERAARSLPLQTKEEKQILTYKSLYVDWLFFHFLWEPRTEYRKMLSPSLNKKFFFSPKSVDLVSLSAGGSRGGARGAQVLPPLFLDQTEAWRAENFFFSRPGSLPPLSVIWRSGSATGYYLKNETTQISVHRARESDKFSLRIYPLWSVYYFLSWAASPYSLGVKEKWDHS